MAERVAAERTGLLFEPGSATDLARKVRWVFGHPEAVDAMRAAAREEYETLYTAERNYQSLIEIYNLAKRNARGENSESSVQH